MSINTCKDICTDCCVFCSLKNLLELLKECKAPSVSISHTSGSSRDKVLRVIRENDLGELRDAMHASPVLSMIVDVNSNACLQLNVIKEKDNRPADEPREVIKRPGNKRLLANEEAVHMPKVKRGGYSGKKKVKS
jgi:hypothetical protein